MMKTALVGTALALLALLPGTALAARTITVSGTGTVTTVPNEADFTFGVSDTAATANAALGANASRMNAVIAALKGQGVAVGRHPDRRDLPVAEHEPDRDADHQLHGE